MKRVNYLLIMILSIAIFSYCSDRGSKAKVWLNEYQLTAGDELVIYFTVPLTFPEDGWIGILPSHDDHGIGHWDMPGLMFKELIAGRTMDSLRVIITDDMLGDWDVRMYKNSNDGTEVFSIPFRIQESLDQ
ncbi:hypothetical protein JXB12_08660 [candidate division KSB1 bacterium]|nr:hypothetical protein [candidate division KSB1 bacterium]